MSAYTILGTEVKGIEKIKGNGWDVDAEHIELNAINAEFIYELEHRYITVKGPAVKDIFKHLCDLIKKNEALTEENEGLAKENQGLKKFCEEQRENFDAKIKKRDERIDCLTEMLQQEIFDGAVLRTRLDEKTENHDRLQDLYLKEINKNNALKKRIRELEEEKMDSAVINYCMNDVVATKNVVGFQPKSFNECDAASKIYEAMTSSPDEIHARAKGIIDGSPNKKFTSVYDTDITRMFPCTYSDAAKEVLGWIDSEMKNNTDYATKIFNKEDVGNIFSITFCKVPVKSEEDE